MAAPNYAQNDYSDFAKLLGVGSAYDTQAQNLINADVQKFYGEQAGQGQALNDYITRLQTVAPLGKTGTETSTQKSGNNPLSTALGVGSLLGGMGGLSSIFGSGRGYSSPLASLFGGSSLANNNILRTGLTGSSNFMGPL